MQTRYQYLLRYILPATDLLMLNAIYIIAFELAKLFGVVMNDELSKYHLIICSLLWLVSSTFFGLYTIYGSRKLERIYRGTWRSVAMHFVLFTCYLLFFNEGDFSRRFLLLFYCLLGAAFLANRFVGTAIQYVAINRFSAAKKVALLGGNSTAIRLASYLERHQSINFYGSLGGDELIYDTKEGELAPVVAERLAEAAEYGVKEVYVAIQPNGMPKVTSLVAEAERLCLRLKFIPDFGAQLNSPYVIGYMGGEFPIITLRNEPLEQMSNRFKKRAFDVAFSTLVILLVMSWLYPIIALLIKLQSPGPVLFKQLRSGRNDEPYWCYKFRSMTVNEESDEKQATKGDVRITKIGAFLRRTSLDEMPQFFNVLMGNMSVVGPRPHMLKHTEEYKQIIGQFMVRHFLKPGITGWAQVNGFRGETKEKKDMENRVKFDIFYLENWSAMFDLRIVFMTIINMLRGEANAY